MDSLLQPAFNELRTGFENFEKELRKVVKGVLSGQGNSGIFYIRLSICVLLIPLLETRHGHERGGPSPRMPMLKDSLSEDINVV